MAHQGLRTATAQQAMAVTDIVNRALAPRIVGSDVRKHLQIRDLDGPSTDGGKRARQSIVLLPVDGSPDGAAMCGWIDTARGEAELRTYPVVARQHAERYRRLFDVGVEEYDALLAELTELLSLDGVAIRFVDAPEPAPGARGPSRALLVGVALAVVLAAALAFAALP